MRGNKLRWIDLGKENLAEVQAFARDHFATPHHIPDDFFDRKFRKIRVFLRDGIMVGYCEVSLEPMVYPAFSKRAEPQDVMEVSCHMRSWCVESYGGGGVGVPRDTVTFAEHTMAKLGYQRTGNEIYLALV